MQPLKGLKKFKKEPKYTHHRSEGLTKRQAKKFAAKVRRNG